MTSRRGMTLLELVVALTVGGAALAAGGAAFSLLTDRRDALLAEADRDARALAARRAMASWIAEIRAGVTVEEQLIGEQGERRTSSGALPDDAVRFVTTADGVARRIRLHVDRRADHPVLVAESETRDGAPQRIVLLDDVAGFDVQYLSSAFGQRAWQRQWSGGRLLPNAVRLRLVAREGAMLPPALALPITVPLANAR